MSLLKSFLSQKPVLIALAVVGLAGCAGVTPSSVTTAVTTTVTNIIASLQPFTDTTGAVSTYSATGGIDESAAFFQPLGTNGRTCASCHQADQSMSLSAASTTALFATTPNDPLFNAIDGANYPTAAAGDANARSLLLTKGLIRVALELPTGTQFTVTALLDPYGCALEIDPATGRQIVSVYRRPLATTALNTMSNIMWDTRETVASLTTASTLSAGLTTDLTAQLNNAVTTHMQGTTTPTAAQTAAILSMEQGLYTAQATDTAAGSLSANGATGGAADLAAVTYYPGINDAFGGDPTGAAFNPAVFTLYTAWQGSKNAQQASIARGEGVFNNQPMQLTNVRGINDNAALGAPNNLRATCSTCHDTPNIGNHSVPLPLDTGATRIAADETDAQIIAGLTQITAPLLPVFQIKGCKNLQGQAVTYTTTDPGKALTTGLCADVNRVKVPTLRGLAARAPYFHNGAANDLTQLVNFYNARFQMNLNAGQKADLVNFLNAL